MAIYDKLSNIMKFNHLSGYLFVAYKTVVRDYVFNPIVRDYLFILKLILITHNFRLNVGYMSIQIAVIVLNIP